MLRTAVLPISAIAPPVPGSGQRRSHEWTLPSDVGFSVERKLSGKRTLQGIVCVAHRFSGAQLVPKRKMFAPERPIPHDQVHMMHAGRTESKELPPGDTLFAAMHVPGTHKSVDVGVNVRSNRIGRRDVDYWFCAEPGDGSASNVLQPQWQRSKHSVNATDFASKALRPRVGIWCQPNGTGLKAQWRRHPEAYHELKSKEDDPFL
jgi:hypothetical protein